VLSVVVLVILLTVVRSFLILLVSRLHISSVVLLSIDYMVYLASLVNRISVPLKATLLALLLLLNVPLVLVLDLDLDLVLVLLLTLLLVAHFLSTGS
jgi:hypothetical protein